MRNFPRLVVTLVALVLVAACGSPPREDRAAARGELRGDSSLRALFARAERDTGVPAELLATMAWVQTRLSMNTDVPDDDGDHMPREHGLMAIGTGGKLRLEDVAALAGYSAKTAATDPRANVLSAATWLARETERRGLAPATAFGWEPVVVEYGGKELAREVVRRLHVGWQGTDDEGDTLALVTAEKDESPSGDIGMVQQSLGYPGAIWNPAYSGNYQAANRGAAEINYVVVHTMQGSYSGAISWFKNSTSNVSAHYMVRSSDGEITQMVDDSDIAWHDACFNSQSIGIEHEGYVQDPGKWYTDAMYTASAKLTAWLCDAYGIPKDKAHILGHDEAPDCSDHTDPGSGWNWDKYMGLVQNGGCKPSGEVCNGMDDDCNGQVDEGDVCVLAELVLPGMGALEPSSSTDMNGDKRADACARGWGGWRCHLAGDGSFGANIDGAELSNDNGWAVEKFYSTIRMGDVNGDGKADVCARAAAGVYCWLSDGAGFPEKIAGPEWSDASGWGLPRFYTTLRLADIDGDGADEVCARSASDFRCHKLVGGAFGPAIIGPAISDADGWGEPKHFGTLRMPDVNGDGKADLCGRASAGLRCWLSDGAGFPTALDGPPLSDAQGWAEPRYWGTLRFADVNGDGKDDVCARSASAFQCWLSDGAGFPTAVTGPELSDAAGWGDIQYWSTLRMGDVNGDGKADVCGRASDRVHCWLSDGAAFPTKIEGPELGNAAGWGKPEYYTTLKLADVSGDGKDDLCARSSTGLSCWPSTGSGFGAAIAGPDWADSGSWNQAEYFQTIQVAGGCTARAESCNQKDDDCDGQIDEDDVCGSSGSGGTGGGGWSGGAGIGTGATSSAKSGTDEADDGGCGCRLAERRRMDAPWLVLAGLFALARRRRQA